MLTHNDICKAVGEIAERYKIVNAYYFGSYAKGTHNDESDLDLLVDFGMSPISLFTVSHLSVNLEDALKTKVDVLVLPLPKDTHLHIDKVVKCYAAQR